MKRTPWWIGNPDVMVCPAKDCGCPIQRTVRGTVRDGLSQHFQQVHPGLPVPVLQTAGAS